MRVRGATAFWRSVWRPIAVCLLVLGCAHTVEEEPDAGDAGCEATGSCPDSGVAGSDATPAGRCAPGATRPCDGSAVGGCRPGVQLCDELGRWGGCEGRVTARTEDCGDGIDNDCDGAVDEGCAGCHPGEDALCEGPDVAQ